MAQPQPAPESDDRTTLPEDRSTWTPEQVQAYFREAVALLWDALTMFGAIESELPRGGMGDQVRAFGGEIQTLRVQILQWSQRLTTADWQGKDHTS